MKKLLVPKRDERIDPGGGSCRHECGDHGHQRKSRRRATHDQRVVALETEEHLFQDGARQACGPDGQRNPYGYTGRGQYERPTYDHIDHGRTTGAKRHAQADLGRALRHRIRESGASSVSNRRCVPSRGAPRRTHQIRSPSHGWLGVDSRHQEAYCRYSTPWRTAGVIV